MSSALPFTEVAGEKLTSEQTAYLEGLFAGLKNRGLTFTDVAPNPAAATVKPDFSSLLSEERIIRVLHPLDAYTLLLEDAAANKPPEKENIFRFKLLGLFYISPKQTSSI